MRIIQGVLHVGKRKQTHYVDVDVSAKDIVHAVEKLYNDLPQCKRYKWGDYIESKGQWQEYSYTHPHNNDDVFNYGGKATCKELLVDEERRTFKDVLRKL